MTKQEANEWLKQVTDKKIRLNAWPNKNQYCAPIGEWEDTSDPDPYYWKFYAADNVVGDMCYWLIREGFEENKFGVKWVFVETFEDYLEMYHND